MTERSDDSVQTISTDELQAELERVLTSFFEIPRTISRLERRPAAKRSSFALEELDLVLDDETSLSLMFKNLSRVSLQKDARRIKPAFLHDSFREIDVYRHLLKPNSLGTPIYYGCVINPPAERHWLFLEKVTGVELYQAGDFAVWQHVAGYLAGMHSRLAVHAELLTQDLRRHLLAYDAGYFRLWFSRVQEFLLGAGQTPSREVRTFLERLAERYEHVIEQVTSLPTTLIHGEFYASNILVQQDQDGLRVCPIDWEMAGVGPGLIDLAALTAGGWSDEQRRALALAYHAALPPNNAWYPGSEAMLAALNYCHLHLAMQWLGWAANWSPPPEHRRNWLDEAMHLADKVGL